jgi:hypothetical protein
MTAAIIFVFSALSLTMFFVSYCRSIVASSAKRQLSPEVQDVTAINPAAAGEDFKRVMQILSLCPERPEDRSGIQAVGAYFRLLNFLRSTVAKVVPSVKTWTEAERGQCTYFAAVALERRIAFSRDMMAEQMDA